MTHLESSLGALKVKSEILGAHKTFKLIHER